MLTFSKPFSAFTVTFQEKDPGKDANPRNLHFLTKPAASSEHPARPLCPIALLAIPHPPGMTSILAVPAIAGPLCWWHPATRFMQMKHYNSYFRHQTSQPPQQPPLQLSRCSQIQTINQRSTPSSAQGIKTRAPALCVGFVLILLMSQDAFNLLQHLQANPWVEGGKEAPAGTLALREAGQYISVVFCFTLHPHLRCSLPKQV